MSSLTTVNGHPGKGGVIFPVDKGKMMETDADVDS